MMSTRMILTDLTKGQLISKAIFLSFNSSKKWTKYLQSFALATRAEVFRSFFGRIEKEKNASEIIWPLQIETIGKNVIYMYTYFKAQVIWECQKNSAHLPLFFWHYLVGSDYKWKMGQFFCGRLRISELYQEFFIHINFLKFYFCFR